MRTWADGLLETLVTQFSQKNDTKRAFLIGPPTDLPFTAKDGCSSSVTRKFNETCVDQLVSVFLIQARS